MTFLAFFIFGISILLCFYIKETHICDLPINVYAFDYRPTLKGKKKIKFLEPGEVHFTYKRINELKLLKHDFGVTHVVAHGYLKDMSKYKLTIGYTIEVNKKEENLRELMTIISSNNSADGNLRRIQREIEVIVSGLTDEILHNRKSGELTTHTDLEKVMGELFSKIRRIKYPVDLFLISGKLEIERPTILEQFEKAELSFEGLTNAGYDEQQINQILKASEKEIYLNNINPVVPENVLRKIRRVYNESNNTLKNYMYELTLKNKTSDDIEKICNDILMM